MASLSEMFTRGELRDIERHKYYLSQQEGRDVGFEAAAQDWLAHHAEEFRERRQQHMAKLQCEEIARHVWIESERACCNVRREAAMDWVRKYAAQWRQWYETEYPAPDRPPKAC